MPLAKMLATLDHAGGGRAVLGIGADWYEAEHVERYRDLGVETVMVAVPGNDGETIERVADELMPEFGRPVSDRIGGSGGPGCSK